MQYRYYAAKSSGLIVYNNHDLQLPIGLLDFGVEQLLYAKTNTLWLGFGS